MTRMQQHLAGRGDLLGVADHEAPGDHDTDTKLDIPVVKGRPLRLVFFGLLMACAATMLASAALASGQPQRKSHPSLKPLWSAFPLAQKQKAAERQADANTARAPFAGDHTLRTFGLVGAAFVTLLVVGGSIAVVAVRHPRPALAGLPSRPFEGGFLMSHARRRLWGRSESNASPERLREQEDSEPQRVVDRLSEYVASESRSAVTAGDQPSSDEPAAEQQPSTAGASAPTDLSAVGDEVAAVLQSAQEAAATIRRSALEESARRRDELDAKITAEIEEARRGADSDRADAQHLRADAEAYSMETRTAADKYGERRRADAEREAAAIVAEAQSRLDAADAEAERKVREAEAGARAHVDMLTAEAERYEERLDNIFVVFREMSSQLEELVGGRRTASREGPGGEGLEDALRPDPTSREP
jgi:hypothetical protein